MLYKRNPQLNRHGELIHLLTGRFAAGYSGSILDTAANFVSINDRESKKVPLLRGKSVFNLFFRKTAPAPEPPSKSRPSGSRPMSSIWTSRAVPVRQGESLLDTIANLSAMAADMFVVRHSRIGCPT